MRIESQKQTASGQQREEERNYSAIENRSEQRDEKNENDRSAPGPEKYGAEASEKYSTVKQATKETPVQKEIARRQRRQDESRSAKVCRSGVSRPRQDIIQHRDVGKALRQVDDKSDDYPRKTGQVTKQQGGWQKLRSRPPYQRKANRKMITQSALK